LYAWSVVCLSAASLVFSGCRGEEPHRHGQIQQTPVSSVQVTAAADGLRIATPAAEFVLLPNGYLTASLLAKNGRYTLDDPDHTPGQVLAVGGRRVSDFSFDVGNARVSEAQGKLGKRGKHIEVRATSPSLTLEETLALDFYDDFPGLALLSGEFRNSGQTDVPLDAVELERHRFNATLVDARAAHHQMWTFQGASLKWGKDEIFPIPPKFSQENPFGAPVKTKDDMGQVGGGIPVVAFWTRPVGEAIGHLETLPLVLSITTSPPGL